MYNKFELGIFEGLCFQCDNNHKLAEIAQWLKQQAERYNCNAMNDLGVMYLTGLGVPRDSSIAFEWFEKSANRYDPAGLYNIGRCCELGVGTHQDFELAADYYDKSIKLGFIPATNAKAAWLNDSRQNDINPKKVYNAWKKASRESALNREATFQLAMCYKNGYGITQNENEALRLLNKVAQQNNLEAQKILRDYYFYNPENGQINRIGHDSVSYRDMAIIWNFVMCQMHGIQDELSNTLLAQGEQMGLVYPRSDCNTGLHHICNEMFRVITVYEYRIRRLLLRKAIWAEESGVFELHPDEITELLDVTRAEWEENNKPIVELLLSKSNKS